MVRKDVNDNQGEMEDGGDERIFEFNGKGVTYFLIIITVIIGVITVLSFYDGVKVNNQQKIALYVNEMNDILIESKRLTEQVSVPIQNNTRPQLNREDEEAFRELLSKANQITPPSNWKGHKEASVTLISEQYMWYYRHLNKLIDRQQDQKQVLKQLETLEEKEKEALLAAFDASNISYTETEDGKIKFSVKTY